MPHVSPNFRGISLTINMCLAEPTTRDELQKLYEDHYSSDPLVRVYEGEIPSWVQSNAGSHHCAVGGITVSEDGMRATVVVTLDNLLKGAATQALQNANLAMGMDELEGIHLPDTSDEWTGAGAERAHAAYIDNVSTKASQRATAPSSPLMAGARPVGGSAAHARQLSTRARQFSTSAGEDPFGAASLMSLRTTLPEVGSCKV